MDEQAKDDGLALIRARRRGHVEVMASLAVLVALALLARTCGPEPEPAVATACCALEDADYTREMDALAEKAWNETRAKLMAEIIAEEAKRQRIGIEIGPDQVAEIVLEIGGDCIAMNMRTLRTRPAKGCEVMPKGREQ